MPTTITLILACGFAVWENRYFGGNWFPKSDAEIICDGIVLLLIAMAMVTLQIDRNKST